MKHLLPYVRRYLKESILAPLFKMLEAAFDLTVPLIVAHMIDFGLPAGEKSLLFRDVGLMILMAVLGLMCSFTAQYFAAKAAIGTGTGLRRELMEKLQSLSMTDLDSLGSATVITRMTSDVNLVQNGCNMFLRLFLRSPFIVFGALILAFRIHRTLALIFVGTIALLFLIVFGIMAVTNPLHKKQQKALDGVTGSTRETLSGVRVIRALGAQERQQKEFSQKNQQLEAVQKQAGKWSGLLDPLTFLVVNLAIVGVLWLGGRTVDGGTLLSGDVIALINYLGQILVELIKLANLIVLLSRAAAGMGRVGQLLDVTSSMNESGQEETPEGETAVEFSHVSLQYGEAAAESLLDLSFSLEKGQTLGVIGGTGSGKTSLVRLISRLYDATSGQVRVLGHPVGSWSRRGLQKNVITVEQNPFLFAGTIRSNLLWGNPEATDSQLWQALKTAQAEEFVKKTGLDGPVEQGGRNLSGGQKQRLTIARALLSQAKILILDDCASALDYATEAALRKALRELDATVIIVSQRTAAIWQADRILVLDDGAQAGFGTHQMLLEACPVYREIWDSQHKKEGGQ